MNNLEIIDINEQHKKIGDNLLVWADVDFKIGDRYFHETVQYHKGNVVWGNDAIYALYDHDGTGPLLVKTLADVDKKIREAAMSA